MLGNELIDVSLQELAQVSDPFLRRLLRGAPENVRPPVGAFFHVALCRELAKDGQFKDVHLAEELLQGVTIVVDVSRSGRWPPLADKVDALPVSALLDRAWEKFIGHSRRASITKDSKKIWEATIEDRDEGSCIGPVWSEEEFSKQLGTELWVPTQRFEVVHKNKV